MGEEDRRCKRSAGPNRWRCSEKASPGKSYCGKHLAQQIQNQKKKRNQTHSDTSERKKKKKKKVMEQSACYNKVERVHSGEGQSTSAPSPSPSPNAMDKPSQSKKESLMCHQCQRSDKSVVICCSNCNRKRYCYECLEKWYPGKTKEEVEIACPFCCGNCNCKACLREVLVVKPCHKELDMSL
ncbi:lysine-specific demethylase JMJ27-like [Quercus suber]|uniref:lysine-specific demethylase JMJ27-like n=1 Tax=Quercus suber TaxID=58331 RepID=UPI0032DFE79C